LDKLNEQDIVSQKDEPRISLAKGGPAIVK
jgi:hypothetical protein